MARTRVFAEPNYPPFLEPSEKTENRFAFSWPIFMSCTRSDVHWNDMLLDGQANSILSTAHPLRNA